jgi:xanthine dehydrogenase YagR molybdenum-binding subunit
MVTSSLTPAARNAAHAPRATSRRVVAPLFEAKPEDIEFVDGKVRVKGSPDKSMPFGEAVKKAQVGEISHRAQRADDYEGYAVTGAT